MGEATCTYATYEKICPKCNSLMRVTLYRWYYPEGALNDSEIELDGVKRLSTSSDRVKDDSDNLLL